MEFDRIALEKGGVQLDYVAPVEGVDRTITDTGKNPSPAFRAAINAFRSYVVWLLDAPDSWLEDLEVRSVTIKRHDGQPRGITVHFMKTCKRARNTPISTNTPYLAERPEGYNGDGTGFLPPDQVALVDELERQATLYQNGERGEQTELLPPNAGAAASNGNGDGEGEKPKAKRRQKSVPGVGDIQNPDATIAPTDDVLRQILLDANRDVPPDAIAAWTSSERAIAQQWAGAVIRARSGDLHKDHVPNEPECVRKAATLPLVETA